MTKHSETRGRVVYSIAPSLALLGLMGAAPVAVAQQAAPASTDNSGGLEEIVVVAQKREQKLIDVPIAISAFSAKRLDDAGISTTEDLASFVPNLTLVPQASGNTTFAVTMRGVNQSDSVITADSPVAIYVDGVVAPKLAGGIFDFIDLERAEVLRGPQGTLYGRNTPAGAINLITRKPSGELGIDATVGTGNYNAREFRAAIDTPSLDLGSLGTVSARVTGRYFARDGWVKDLSNGEYLDGRDRWGGRIAIRWEPRSDLTVDYTFDRIYIDETPPAAQLTADFSGFLGPFVSTTRQSQIGTSYSFPGSGGSFGIGRTNTRLTITGQALTIDWKAADYLELRSITGYRQLHDEEPTDFDGTPVAWADFDVYNNLRTFQQEVQATGKLFDEQFSYVAGAFYYTENAGVVAPGVFGFGTVEQTTSFATDNDAMAVYTQLEYTPHFLDDRLTIGAGARYTYEDRSLNNATLTVNNALVLAHIDHVTKSFDNATPSFFVSYKVADSVNTYFRYAEGWRSGGFNGRSSTVEQYETPFQPETLTSYELGVKGSLFDRRVNFDIGGFISDYQDLQTVTTEPTVTGIGFQTTNTNIGKVQISGIEAAAEFQITRNLRLNASYAYIYNDTQEYDLCLPVGVPGCKVTNLGNQRVAVLSPRNSFTIGLDWRALETEMGNIRLHADASWKGDEIGGGATIPVFPLKNDPSFIPAYTLLDARLVWEQIPMPVGSLEVAVWGKNLLDEKTAQFAVNLASSLGIGTTRFLTPPTFGVEMSYHY